MVDRPPELAGGQDDPPNVRAVLQTTIRLLEDIGPELREDPDLVLRLSVTKRVLIRTRNRLAEP